MISSWVLSPGQQVSPAGYGLQHWASFSPCWDTCFKWLRCAHETQRSTREKQPEGTSAAVFPILCRCGFAQLRTLLLTHLAALAHANHVGYLQRIGVVIPRMQPQALCWQRYACSLLASNSKPSNFGYLVYNPGEYPVQTWSISWIKAGRLWNSEQHRNEYIAFRCRSREKQARICLQKT